MVYKSRVIPLIEYFDILQKEYICALIRERFYPESRDKEYLLSVMEKKKNKVENIGDNEGVSTIFDDEGYFTEKFNEVVNEYGFPNFIYSDNAKPNSKDKYYKFPYKGTLVYVDDKESVGVTDYYDFDKQMVYVFMGKNKSTPFAHSRVHRLTLEQTDKYYYYSSGEFAIKGVDGTFKPISYNIKLNIIKMYMGGDVYVTEGSNVRRILNII